MQEATNDFSMKALTDHFKANISLGNIILGAFIIGGFYYVTPQSIKQNTESIQHHVSEEFQPLQSAVRENTQAINNVQSTMVPRSEAVDQSDLVNLKELMREIQQSQNVQMKQLNNRLDYLINRIESR